MATNVKQKESEKKPDTHSALCPDWVFLNNGNVHAAKDRGWFKSYTPFSSSVDVSSPIVSASSHPIPVLGIGTVEIPTKRSPNISGASAHGNLLLHEVLHVPDLVCNIIGQPLMTIDGCSIRMEVNKKSKGAIIDGQSKNVAYFDPKSPLFAIKLRHPPNGPKLGESMLRDGTTYMLSFRWGASEKRKWQAFKAENETFGSAGENNERFREEGRAMAGPSTNEEETSNTTEFEDPEDEDEESDFEGHLADFNFTAHQLEWIAKHYGNSGHFMKCLGLNFFKEEDIEEAKVTVEVMMTEDE
ncbi:hypothetical protein DE146DRAFT_771161 [Phaeosphaeria sp. MPI-PUGE-AT-0046c]|nr:hypothetical protein DE146DRAFT_771161 [Phaeosphaeria sp. MPI-PUGE-AT-0046c]